MKLNRFADQAMARVMSAIGSNHPVAGVADVMDTDRAIAAAQAAMPCTASRATG